MGLGLFKISSSSQDRPRTREVLVIRDGSLMAAGMKRPRPGNPNAANWELLRSWYSDPFLLVMVRYPDCTNYEGVKVMLYRNCTTRQLRQQGMVDPHFSKNKRMHSPIARFKPTEDGWNMGRKLIEAMK